ncbi:MAG: flagellar biosynthesis anti-sigma factor FlgM [Acidobacteriaceae bacterium]|nr:flagellar biosynthesis anti-sigma factor FlgM [Acidobacteriaceae bacterium]
MRIADNYAYLPQSSMRAAVPAPAREILRPASESRQSDSVSGSALANIGNREAQIEELRTSVQSGQYDVKAEQVSAKIIDWHLQK